TVRIKARRDDDQIGNELRSQLADRGIESAPLIHGRSRRPQRHVERVAKTTTVAGFTTSASARIPRILVHREIEDSRIFIKDALRAVTVMHVPIDDGDSLDFFISLLCVPRGHGDVTEET